MTTRTAGSGFQSMREATSVARVAGSEGVRSAPPGGMPFDPPNCQDRTKGDTPCSAKRANGTMFCAGHLRKRGDL